MRANNLNIDDQLYLFVKPFEYLCQVNEWQIVDFNLRMLTSEGVIHSGVSSEVYLVIY